MVVILGRSQVVWILEASQYNPGCWICKSETSGKVIVLGENELGELVPASLTTLEEQRRNVGAG
jgi:hypothetical protein